MLMAPDVEKSLTKKFGMQMGFVDLTFLIHILDRVQSYFMISQIQLNGYLVVLWQE